MLSNRHGNFNKQAHALQQRVAPTCHNQRKARTATRPRAARNKYSNLKEKINYKSITQRDRNSAKEIQFQRNHKLKLKQLKDETKSQQIRRNEVSSGQVRKINLWTSSRSHSLDLKETTERLFPNVKTNPLIYTMLQMSVTNLKELL